MNQHEEKTAPPKASSARKANSEKNITLLFVLTAVVQGILGTILGTFMLANISGAGVDFALGLFPAHPYLQILGFVTEFIVGVAYSLLPRFKIRTFPASFGYLSYAAITSANVLFLLSALEITLQSSIELIGSFLLVLGALLFLYQVTAVALKKGGGFPEANPFMMISGLSLVLIATILLLRQSVPSIADTFSSQFIFLALIGFGGSMIYAVEIRSVSFRQSNYRKRTATPAWISQAIGVVAMFTSLLFSSSILYETGVFLFLLAAIFLILTIRIFEFVHPMMYRPAMTASHYKIVQYNQVCIASGSSWLLLGCLLGAFTGSGTENFVVRDTFIHSIAIGFIGSTITCFAPMFLPTLLGRRAPISGLSLWPITILNIGLIIRVLGNFSSLFLSSLPVWESLSGPLILAAMVWFLVMLRGVGRARNLLPIVASVARKSEPETQKSLDEIGEAKMTLLTRKTKREVALSIWFVARNNSIYMLPMSGKSSSWCQNILVNPKVRVTIGSKTVSGNARLETTEDEIQRVIKLFKDKYGESTFDKFFRRKLDCAVIVSQEREGWNTLL